MRHICLFPWYFKEGLLAEGEEIYRIKQGTNAVFLVNNTSFSLKIHCIQIHFTCNAQSVTLTLTCNLMFHGKKYLYVFDSHARRHACH